MSPTSLRTSWHTKGRPPGRPACFSWSDPLPNAVNAFMGNESQEPLAPDLRAEIAGELYAALEQLGAEPELLVIAGSWRDMLSDAEVLAMLRDYNAGRMTLPLQQ
jgi:hypothetical protein